MSRETNLIIDPKSYLVAYPTGHRNPVAIPRLVVFLVMVLWVATPTYAQNPIMVSYMCRQQCEQTYQMCSMGASECIPPSRASTILWIIGFLNTWTSTLILSVWLDLLLSHRLLLCLGCVYDLRNCDKQCIRPLDWQVVWPYVKSATCVVEPSPPPVSSPPSQLHTPFYVYQCEFSIDPSLSSNRRISDKEEHAWRTVVWWL